MSRCTRNAIYLSILTFAVALSPTLQPAHADTITVCWDGTGDYLTIQEGINAAVDDDVVEICDGTYTGPGNKNLDFGGRAITVRSESGDPNACIIDCAGDGRGFYFHSAETGASVVDGFTIRNGWTNQDSPGGPDGAAMFCEFSSPTIVRCVLLDNTTQSGGSGGALCCQASNPTIRQCAFVRNTSTHQYGIGGGIACKDSNPIVVDCSFIANRANSGGGMYNERSSPLLERCIFVGNSGRRAQNWITSGGVDNTLDSNPTFRRCVFVGNEASFGGAVGNYANSNATLSACLLVGNSALSPGFGVGGGGVGSLDSSPVISNCLIVGNRADRCGGAVISSASQVTLTNCSLVDNSAPIGQALACDRVVSNDPPSYVGIANCIFWNPSDEIWNNDGSTITITYSDIEGGWPGEGNLDTAPLFVAGPSGTWTADAVYDGETFQVALTDADAKWRPDELAGKLVNPDTTQALQFLIVANTATTATVWADWATIDAQVSGVTAGMTYQIHDYHLTAPSPCIDAGDNEAVPDDTTTDLDGHPRFIDLPCIDDTGSGTPPIVDIGPYEHATKDCNNNGVTDDCDILDGTSEDCQANGIPDECDIADGTSQDYDLNGVPDECDPDCNGNGVPDSCDVDCSTGNCAGHPLGCGSSEDCQPNSIPDECELAYMFSEISQELSPIGHEVPQEYRLVLPPRAVSDVDLQFWARADLSTLGEWIDVFINDVWIRSVFGATGDDCPGTPNDAEVHVPMDLYNSAVNGGDAVIKMVASSMVDPYQCDPPSHIVVWIGYVAHHDCNANGVLDECDIADGTSQDVNGNGLPDECERLGDLNGDGCVNQADLGIFLADWDCDTGDCPGDADNDGDTDQADLGLLLANWGAGC